MKSLFISEAEGVKTCLSLRQVESGILSEVIKNRIVSEVSKSGLSLERVKSSSFSGVYKEWDFL